MAILLMNIVPHFGRPPLLDSPLSVGPPASSVRYRINESIAEQAEALLSMLLSALWRGVAKFAEQV